MNRSVFLVPKPTDGIFSGISSAIIRWEIVGDRAILGKRKTSIEIEIDHSQPLLGQLCSHVNWDSNKTDIKESTFSANEYYPRIYRPTYSDDDNMNMRITTGYSSPPNSEVEMYESLVQLSSMTEQLKELFTVISPDIENLSVYGHKIRNLLVIACTEVECQWKGILRENDYAGHRLTTRDYIKILPALCLDEYKIKLPMYPKIESRIPFLDWSETAPTQSLNWYDAYNAVKHDRESNFDKAKLIYVIDAIMACAILFQAQYGNINHWRDLVGNFYLFTEKPKWEEYLGYTKVGFNDSNWEKISYPFA